jgi:drug/metabolite transporter (DMT)-like permease
MFSNARLLTMRKPLQDVVLFGAIIAVGAVFFFVNPATTAFYPKCLFHEMTGLYCPGCGSTRALYCLLHGEFREALCDNALVVLALPLLGAILLARTFRRRPPVVATQSKLGWLGLLLAAIAVFGIVRNIPCRPFSLLTPLRKPLANKTLALPSADRVASRQTETQ